MKINKLEFENVKRIKAVQIEPSKNGLTVIGGKNRQGKTSVLDAIAWALGGENYRPSDPAREGSVTPPYLKVTMSNGLIVERKGKNSALKVTDPSGQKAGQQLLDTFVEKLAINLPKFMESSDKDKAKTLLKIIGVGEQLEELDRQEKELYSERTAIGQIADRKKKFADEQPYYPDAPDDIVSPADMIRMQQEILARNGQKQQWIREYNNILNEIDILERKIEEYESVLRSSREQKKDLETKAKEAQKTPAELRMESTAELEDSIAHIDEINRKVRANLDKAKAEDDARDYIRQYEDLTMQIEDVREQKESLLNAAELPLPELSVRDGDLVYQGQKWDNMSGADRLKVSTAIVRKLNPECGFVLLDKLEQMDLDTLQEFGQWLETEGLQAIATRVSTGDECSIIIEDGYVTQPEKKVVDWSNF